MSEHNPFAGLRADTHSVIETMFGRIRTAGEWDDEDEERLAQWREARGEDAKGDWRWWAGHPDCESYGEDAATREAAIEIGKRDYVEDGAFEIIEARLWNDDVKEGEEISEFAESRNKEVISVEEGEADA